MSETCEAMTDPAAQRQVVVITDDVTKIQIIVKGLHDGRTVVAHPARATDSKQLLQQRRQDARSQIIQLKQQARQEAEQVCHLGPGAFLPPASHH